MVWDTAGQEEFDALTKQYYRNAQGCVIAFSTVDRASFEAVEQWKAKVEAEVADCAMVLVQNKVDLIDKATASSEEVRARPLLLRAPSSAGSWGASRPRRASRGGAVALGQSAETA
jgi:Ras-related protein Rab-23